MADNFAISTFFRKVLAVVLGEVVWSSTFTNTINGSLNDLFWRQWRKPIVKRVVDPAVFAKSYLRKALSLDYAVVGQVHNETIFWLAFDGDCPVLKNKEIVEHKTLTYTNDFEI